MARRPLDVHSGRPSTLFGLPGCSPYALVLTALCLVVIAVAIARGDPAGIVIAVALVFVFAPLLVIVFLARRQGTWPDDEALWAEFEADESAREEETPTDVTDGNGSGEHAWEAGKRDTD